MASSRYPSDAERVSVSYSNPGGPVRHARFTLTSAVTVPRVVRRSGAAIGGDSRGERYDPYFFALSPCALNSKKKLHENNQRHFHPYPRRVGIVSALLSAALPSGGYLSILYVGAVYGVVLAIYFICCRGFASERQSPNAKVQLPRMSDFEQKADRFVERFSTSGNELVDYSSELLHTHQVAMAIDMSRPRSYDAATKI